MNLVKQNYFDLEHVVSKKKVEIIFICGIFWVLNEDDELMMKIVEDDENSINFLGF